MNGTSDTRVEQVIRLCIGALVLGPVSIGYLIDVLRGAAFTLDPTYALMAGSVVTFFFAGSARSLATQAARITNGYGPTDTTSFDQAKAAAEQRRG